MSERQDRTGPRGLGGRFSLAVDPERLERFMACGRAERIARARQWQITMGEMFSWAARCPDEVPLINGELFFIAESLADNETREPAAPARPAGIHRPGAALSEPRPAATNVGGVRQAGVGR